ncbi:DUF4148 domain-containing protein [Variovorax dokdonensis]|uniref:DUF4148 domain-containing protein n=1 Tax=Variovorax dokdonensis TaxID=344883 RepID=A0ABT7NFX2_9BURK|nr:DUF4148 domain-containing protein [Variovorax dokdonensis]MDM0046849.1 DUF4148 domain-containing protein [Variovorax dokdonensis]
MTKSKFFAAAAVALFAAAGAAQAETYEGVHSATSALSRADVQATGVAAASAKDQNVPRGSRGAETVAVSRDRAEVRAEAVSAASRPDQNVVPGSRYNSKVISTMPAPVERAQSGPANGTRM